MKQLEFVNDLANTKVAQGYKEMSKENLIGEVGYQLYVGYGEEIGYNKPITKDFIIRAHEAFDTIIYRD